MCVVCNPAENLERNVARSVLCLLYGLVCAAFESLWEILKSKMATIYKSRCNGLNNCTGTRQSKLNSFDFYYLFHDDSRIQPTKQLIITLYDTQINLIRNTGDYGRDKRVKKKLNRNMYKQNALKYLMSH